MRVMEEAFDYLDAPIKRLTGPDVPIPCSGPLEEMFAPSEADIVTAVKELLR
jgi:pyruvate dehydrogenase E1 component beta subunit